MPRSKKHTAEQIIAKLRTAELELARHSDIKMTMKYTHIGVEDQARALQNIPTAGLASNNDGLEKSRSGCEDASPKSWECPGSESGVTNGQSVSSDGNEGGYTLNDETPVTDRGCDQISSSDNSCQKWRRRESNPRLRIRKSQLQKKLRIQLFSRLHYACSRATLIAASWHK